MFSPKFPRNPGCTPVALDKKPVSGGGGYPQFLILTGKNKEGFGCQGTLNFLFSNSLFSSFSACGFFKLCKMSFHTPQNARNTQPNTPKPCLATPQTDTPPGRSESSVLNPQNKKLRVQTPMAGPKLSVFEPTCGLHVALWPNG